MGRLVQVAFVCWTLLLRGLARNGPDSFPSDQANQASVGESRPDPGPGPSRQILPTKAFKT